MITVWVLVFYMAWGYNGGPALIDNIHNKDECLRVLNIINQNHKTSTAQCIEVRKTK